MLFIQMYDLFFVHITLAFTVEVLLTLQREGGREGGREEGRREEREEKEIGRLTSMVFLGSSLLTEYLSSSITALHAAGEITHPHITCPALNGVGDFYATCS